MRLSTEDLTITLTILITFVPSRIYRRKKKQGIKSGKRIMLGGLTKWMGIRQVTDARKARIDRDTQVMILNV